jgi:hypothetical protein
VAGTLEHESEVLFDSDCACVRACVRGGGGGCSRLLSDVGRIPQFEKHSACRGPLSGGSSSWIVTQKTSVALSLIHLFPRFYAL